MKTFENAADDRWRTLARSWTFLQAELLVCTAAVAGCRSTVPMAELLGQNGWPSEERNLALGVWAALAVLLTVASAGGVWRWGLARVNRLTEMCLPLIPLALLPWLLTTDHWFHHPLPYMVILALFGFLTEACLNAALSQIGGALVGTGRFIVRLKQRAPWLPLALVLLGAASYASYTGYLTVLNHHRFGTGAYDMGIFDNVMFNSLKGYPFRSTIMFEQGAKSFLLGHSIYLSLAFLPIYGLAPCAETLLWLQAVLVSSGAVVLFFFARTQLPAGLSAALSLLYLLFAPMHGSQFYDFHWLTCASPFLFFLFYALVKGRALLIGGATLMCWLLREDVAPGLAVLGAILLLSGKRPKAGLFLVCGSSLWFAVNKFIIMPSFGEWWFANLYENLTTPTEKGYGSVIKTLLLNPLFVIPSLLTANKLVYLLHLLAPLALIPVRRFTLAALMLPGALFTVLTNAESNFSVRYQYSAHYTAYLFAALVFYFWSKQPQPGAALSPQTQTRSAATLGALVLCMICHSTTYGVVLKPSSFAGGTLPIAFSLTAKEQKELKALNTIRVKIPEDASVTSTTKDSSHVSNRLNIYAFGHSSHLSDYLLINPSSFGMGATNQHILAALGSNQYGLLDKVAGITLWKRGHSSKDTPDELQRLKRRLGGSRRSR